MTTRGLRPVPLPTMLSHGLGVSYLWGGEYSWAHATPVLAYMLLGMLALHIASGRLFSWWVGIGTAWTVATGAKPMTMDLQRLRARRSRALRLLVA